MSKTEWPTASKLEELKSEGKVPFSTLASGLVVFCAVLAGLGFSGQAWNGLIDSWRAALNPAAAADSFNLLAQTIFLGLKIIFLPVLCACALAVCSGFFQTKFVWRSEALHFNLSRLARFDAISPVQWTMRAGFALLLVISGVAGALVLFRFSTYQLLQPLNLTRVALSNWFKAAFQDNLPLACALLTGLAVLVWFLRRMRFMYAHRMTRAEVEREAREE